MKFMLNNAPNFSPNITETDLEHFYIRSSSSQISKQSNTAAEKTQLLSQKKPKKNPKKQTKTISVIYFKIHLPAT